jgi:peptidoglycan/xylan/chitin deacetylase (PgdA/CDA1 family)
MTQASGRLYLLYHELRPARSLYSYALETAEFGKQLDLFLKLRTDSQQSLWPEITFDDGHVSNFEYALPLLQSRNLKASFFITVGWIGQRADYMGWSELQQMHNAGQSIGAHGWTHTLLTHCDSKSLHHELVDARFALEDKLGAPVTTMSLPGGRYNRKVLAACEQAGYTQVFTSAPKIEPDSNATTLGRLNIRGDMTLEWIARLLQPGSNVVSSLERQYRRKAAAQSLLGDRLYAKLWAILNRRDSSTDAEDVAAT